MYTSCAPFSSLRLDNKLVIDNSALQKQVGCFNHRVVTIVADKLKRQWLPEVFFGMEV